MEYIDRDSREWCGRSIGSAETHIGAIQIETVPTGLLIRRHICSGIGCVSFAHALFPVVEIFPCMPAGGCDIHSCIHAGFNRKRGPCPAVILALVELHVLLSPLL